MFCRGPLVVSQAPVRCRILEAFCSLPALAGRAADPLRPYPCKVANSVDVFIEFKLAVRS